MKPTTIVNVSRKYDVYIGRAGNRGKGYFGNPYYVGADRKKCLDQYRAYFERRLSADPEFYAAIQSLRGKTLGCFCEPGQDCHGQIIVEYLENNNAAS